MNFFRFNTKNLQLKTLKNINVLFGLTNRERQEKVFYFRRSDLECQFRKLLAGNIIKIYRQSNSNV